MNKLDRSAYNRADALNAIAHHMAKMLHHRRQASDIARQFGLELPLPEEKPMLNAIAHAAKLKHVP